jgi:DNA repair protein RecN (Recombination protein N)
VAKSTKDGTHTDVSRLETQERIDEIARMLGGVEITTTTRNHAAEMVQRANIEKVAS